MDDDNPWRDKNDGVEGGVGKTKICGIFDCWALTVGGRGDAISGISEIDGKEQFRFEDSCKFMGIGICSSGGGGISGKSDMQGGRSVGGGGGGGNSSSDEWGDSDFLSDGTDFLFEIFS